ncbi:MAG: hypothetical protein HC897_12705 [Thermoanaerobaculia bacterium]|nr:hypothetical protein [Thermoanaerobaculia bacterium]
MNLNALPEIVDSLPAMENPYVDLTLAFNRGRLRAILSSGQAVVLYQLAVMSKDGDWILREDAEALDHVLGVLAEQGARYRYGAPLDLRWLAGGWSSHLELRRDGLRLRTDFVTRPPRISAPELEQMWREPVVRDVPVVGLEALAELKKTNREKDYPVIGELARQMLDPRSQLLYSRSSRDLERLARQHPDAVADLVGRRPLLACIGAGREELDRQLDAERRVLMRVNEERLAAYFEASQGWAAIWSDVQREMADRSLWEAHAMMTARAVGILPFAPLGVTPP